jgi:hypothetical protein
MTLYARINPDTGAVEQRDFAEVQPAHRRWVPLIFDAKPAASATQVIVNAGIVVGLTEAHQTYGLREKTADELEAEALLTEKAQINGYLEELNVQLGISNVAFNAMSNAQKLDVLRDDRRITMKAVKFLLRQVKAGLR